MKKNLHQPTYLVVGNGRLARHLNHCFELLGIRHYQWNRKSNSSFSNCYQSLNQKITHTLLCISDSAIEPFLEEHPFLKTETTCVHFSGLLVTSWAYSAHPLASFTERFYPAAFYSQIPFVIEDSGPDFSDLLPGIENPHYRIPKELKSLYHALCVVAGNGTSLLWENCAKKMEIDLGLSRKILLPFFHTITTNLKIALESDDHYSSVTGPFVRGDLKTVELNLKSLSEHPLKEVYESLYELFKFDRGKQNEHK